MNGYYYVLQNKSEHYKNIESFESAEEAINYYHNHELGYDLKNSFTIAVFYEAYEENDGVDYIVAYLNVI